MSGNKKTDCILFQSQFNRPLQIVFDQKNVSSDGGVLLAAAADRRLGLTDAMSSAFTDPRRAGSVRFSMDVLFRQRILPLVCGYQDANDVTITGNDPLMRLMVRNDHEAGLASQSTISRFENSLRRSDLYRLGNTQADIIIQSHRNRLLKKKLRRITIDMDGTVDPTHGQQELTFFNAFYDTHCYKPLLAFLTFDDEPEQHLVTAMLRPGNASDKAGALSILRRLIRKLRVAFPGVRIRVRMDGGFASEEIFSFLESCSRLDYAINFPKNPKITKKTRSAMKQAFRLYKQGKRPRVYGECRYKAGKWSKPRRVIYKAEIVEYRGRPLRENPRFIVTNMKGSTKSIYEKFYCARGDSENRIKELKDSIGLDRTSCRTFNANQFRVFLSVAAYVILQEIRLAAANTNYARAQTNRIVNGLLKIAARVTVSVRRILIQMPEQTPVNSDWRIIAGQLGAAIT